MRIFVRAGMVSLLLGSGAAFAGEQTVNLGVEGMTCASCPYQVQSALKKVDGVTKIDVSLAEKQAVVTYDDTKTDVASLTKATLDAGFPSKLKTGEEPVVKTQ